MDNDPIIANKHLSSDPANETPLREYSVKADLRSNPQGEAPRSAVAVRQRKSIAKSFASESSETASEAIVVVDIVDATYIGDLLGWESFKRLKQELGVMISELGTLHALACQKSLGDGYLLSFCRRESAETTAAAAVDFAVAILNRINTRNLRLAKEQHLNIRIAIHFGQVDVLDGDREGLDVSYTFRLESISHSSLENARDAIRESEFPTVNYILSSERIRTLIERGNRSTYTFQSCGLFKLKGLPGWHDVYIVRG